MENLMLSEIKHTRKITNDGSYKNVSFRYLKTSINEHTVDFTYEPDFEFECDIINNHENKTWIRNDDSKFAEFYSSLLNRITEILQKENKRFKREFFMDKTRFSFKINDSTDIRIPIRDRNNKFVKLELNSLFNKKFS